VHVTAGTPGDVDGLLALAAEVEDWFGPMVEDPGFHDALNRSIQRGTAWVVRSRGGHELLGGLLTGGRPPAYQLNWLVVTASARGNGVGSALVRHAVGRYPRPCRVGVVTFGADHPAAIDSGARPFYERLGFVAGAPAPRGPEGGSRQWYHLALG
jgi:GNAT superfamily N-acetyltransferase